MAIVKINTRGTVVQWDDITARTPCVLNILDEDFNAFISYLDSVGIDDYDILVAPSPSPTPPIIPSTIDELWLDLRQLSKDVFGDQYSFNQDGLRSTRVVGTFTNGETTPDISNRRVWKTNNSVPTDITNFIGGRIEDVRYILFWDTNTTIKHNANINLAGDADFNGEVGDIIIFVKVGSKWYEVGRSSGGGELSSDLLPAVTDTINLGSLEKEFANIFSTIITIAQIESKAGEYPLWITGEYIDPNAEGIGNYLEHLCSYREGDYVICMFLFAFPVGIATYTSNDGGYTWSNGNVCVSAPVSPLFPGPGTEYLVPCVVGDDGNGYGTFIGTDNRPYLHIIDSASWGEVEAICVEAAPPTYQNPIHSYEAIGTHWFDKYGTRLYIAYPSTDGIDYILQVLYSDDYGQTWTSLPWIPIGGADSFVHFDIYDNDHIAVVWFDNLFPYWRLAIWDGVNWTIENLTGLTSYHYYYTPRCVYADPTSGPGGGPLIYILFESSQNTRLVKYDTTQPDNWILIEDFQPAGVTKYSPHKLYYDSGTLYVYFMDWSKYSIWQEVSSDETTWIETELEDPTNLLGDTQGIKYSYICANDWSDSQTTVIMGQDYFDPVSRLYGYYRGTDLNPIEINSPLNIDDFIEANEYRNLPSFVQMPDDIYIIQFVSITQPMVNIESAPGQTPEYQAYISVADCITSLTYPGEEPLLYGIQKESDPWVEHTDPKQAKISFSCTDLGTVFVGIRVKNSIYTAGPVQFPVIVNDSKGLCGGP